MPARNDTTRKQSESQKKINVFLNKNISIVALVISIFIFTYSYLAVIRPKYDDIVESLQGSMNSQDQEYIIKKGETDDLKELIAFYEGTTEINISKIDRMLPESYVKERLFVELGHLVAQGGFTLNYVGIKRDSEMTEEEKKNLASKKGEDVSEIIIETRKLPREIDKTKVSIYVSSVDYFGLKYLVSVLENNLKLVDITDISFDPGGNTATIDFWTYHLKT